jgi:hypothetical protein
MPSRPVVLPRISLIAASLLVAATAVWAQKTAVPPAPAATADDVIQSSFDLTEAQSQRLSEQLPLSLPKWQKRLPFHAVVLGDAVAGMDGFDDSAGNHVKGYPARFLEQIAGQFFYTGGVRIIKPSGKHPDKAIPAAGPEITLRNLAGRGRTVQHGLQAWTALGASPAPDLVIIAYGAAESAAGADGALFSTELTRLVTTVQKAGAEVLIAGPSLTAADPPEISLATTRAFTVEARRVATLLKVPFFDLGDLVGLVRFDAMPGAVPDDPAELFAAIVQSYRTHFRWAGVENYTVPQEGLHEDLGRRMFRTLLDGETAVPWLMKRGVATFTSADTFSVQFSVQNLASEDRTLTLLPLVPVRWLPGEAEPRVSIKAGKNKKVTLTYQRNNQPSVQRWNAFPFSDGQLHLPVLVCDGTVARIEEVATLLTPTSLVWNPRTVYGADKTFTIDQQLYNYTGAALSGAEWTATLGDQKLEGKIDLPPNTPVTLPLQFALPDDDATRQKSGLLVVTLFSGNVLQRWERSLEMVRHMGLKEVLHLKPSVASSSSVSPPLTLRCDADSTALYLTVDIGELVMEDDANGIAMGAALTLDARTFGSRLGPGGVEPIRYRLGVADGYGETGRIAPWAFGTGYAMAFDENAVPIRLLSQASGGRRITWVVPRSYLYLHDFTLGNGNSHLGFNLSLNFYRQPDANGVGGGYPPYLAYSLTRGGRHPEDAESLPVLELTEKPTRRWTVIHW